MLVETQNLASSSSSFYTGEIVLYPVSSEMKLQILNNYISTNNLDVDWNESIAMGDDERDFLILKAVGKPILFEPSSGLKSLAIENGFEILYRDSILENFRRVININ